MKVTTILELGTPLEMIQLLQTPWEERFKVRKQNHSVLSVAFRSQTEPMQKSCDSCWGKWGFLVGIFCLLMESLEQADYGFFEIALKNIPITVGVGDVPITSMSGMM